MTDLEFALDPKYRVSAEEILRNRRAYHYFRQYVTDGERSAVLADAWPEIGRRGVCCIARWLGRNADIFIATARRAAQAREAEGKS